jgi:hypothetical protein
MPAAQPGDDRHESGAPPVRPRCRKIGICADEVTGDPAEQPRAGPNEDGITVEQREHERGAEDEVGIDKARPRRINSFDPFAAAATAIILSPRRPRR